ncbi:hypothetical protein [Parvularcula sp. LCG005]|uniref:hypothetical protein n=1 Tax=Parvularcula sp. LCG005 TaxID=3078805 RepID=UPI002942C1E4|nr:hypothetical protein [Parvularcula sp. LCG005]WOI54321.1 hypothetical protein RUI03_04795 [Parvularcula sp. LCG005]
MVKAGPALIQMASVSSRRPHGDDDLDPIPSLAIAIHRVRRDMQRAQLVAALLFAASQKRASFSAVLAGKTLQARETQALGCALAKWAFGVSGKTQAQLGVLPPRHYRSINRDIKGIEEAMERDDDFDRQVEAMLDTLSDAVTGAR